MSVTLPKEIYYKQAASLPEGTQSNSIVASPINGATFGPSSIIQFDLVQRGYLVPESMYIRYKNTITGGVAAAVNGMKGTPVYTPFSRLETIVGSQVVESIQNYHQLCNMLVNCKMNYSQKLGLAYPFGYGSTQAASSVVADVFNLGTAAVNGLSLVAQTNAAVLNVSVAAPLGCILSNADNLVPLKYMPSCRIQLTTDSLANCFLLAAAAANAIQGYSLSNLELCYDVIDFSPMVDQAISSMNGGKLTIKSQSYLSSGVTTGVLAAGTVEYLFNQRLASIKSLFCHLTGGGGAGVSLNGLFDSCDITSGAGDYQWFIGGAPYPPRPISTVLNKAGVMMELSAAFGPAHDLLTSNFSITPTEFNSSNATVTTLATMGKFYLGTNVEKLSTNGALLTGISSQGSPISFRVSANNGAANSQTIQLICCYDALLEVDMMARSLIVLQ